jgi:hypothetical protein
MRDGRSMHSTVQQQHRSNCILLTKQATSVLLLQTKLYCRTKNCNMLARISFEVKATLCVYKKYIRIFGVCVVVEKK